MPENNKLVTGLHRGIEKERHGSYKTRYNNIREATQFVKAIRELGCGVQAWKDVSNKHVGRAVAYWKNKGLSDATA